ncbi:hypothetical protein acdb102_30920 [Acidothermaceae bacterium B102]|nr:hypothetical protein acdb102_30920 [Acidothermaceae bacterium B102]
MTTPTYSFLPWLRQGVAGQITAADLDPTVKSRAGVQIALNLTANALSGPPLSRPINRAVELYGPGDVVGIDPRVIVRTEPRDWITNAEPNYLATIEFYDEDFPWRYTPAAPDGSGLRLRPWIALVVLEEGVEFVEVKAHAERPLPSIDILDSAALPSADDLWAWAHVHVNTGLTPDGSLTSQDMSLVLPRLSAAVDADHDVAYSRLVCPRHLKADTRYHAFVVPVFETGRLAGLGLAPSGAPFATHSAWADYAGKPATGTLPFYHRWYFRTGDQGDFEYLVRLLEPRVVDARVGVRDIDVRHPEDNLRGITDPILGGVLRLGGALRVPRDALDPDEQALADRYDNWDRKPPAAVPYPQPFQQDLAAFVNLPDDYATTPAAQANTDSGLGLVITGDPDPLLTAPLYGRWHALTQRLLTNRDGTPADPDDNWVHQLNLDPRHRVAAGFGTLVIQTNQERYMEAAWGQIGDVLDANRQIRQARLSQQVAAGWYAAQLAPLVTRTPERALTLVAPAGRHLLLAGASVPAAEAAATGNLTLRHRLDRSVVPATLVSTTMRRVARPGSRLMRALPTTAAINATTLLTRVDAGEVSAAPPVVTPPGLVTTDEVADLVPVPALPSWIPVPIADWLLGLLRTLRQLPWLLLLGALVALILAVVLVVVAGAVGIALGVILLAVAALLAAVALALRRSETGLADADSLRPAALTVAAVDALPPAPGFVLVTLGQPAPPLTTGPDSPTAVRFKNALRDWHGLYQAALAVEVTPALTRYGSSGIASLAAAAVTAVDPATTVPRRVLGRISLPDHVRADLGDVFQEVMAYPRIDQPMYEPLKDISDELLLPNLNLIPQNTVTLLETNQPFIEAYMVGLNHEMARELLWREYPTDQRGTPFRQFWDVRGARTAPGLTPDQAAESLRDIPPLHLWPRRSDLGDHNSRATPGHQTEAVLVIRGELLKKYPNAVIYAQQAAWQLTNGHIDPAKERVLVPLTDAQQADPPAELVKTPLYEARTFPDIAFFGFDLSVDEARGDNGTQPGDRPGWFFCIKERPGEPRFGFDVDRDGPIQTVNDLAWPDAGAADGAFVSAATLASFTLAPLGPDDVEKTDQRADDVTVVTAPVSAARWAYLLYQAPVLVAVHAAEMLRPATT